MRVVKHLVGAQAGYQALLKVWAEAKTWLVAGHRLELEVRPERRNTVQNDRMWAMLTEVARQVEWHGQYLQPEEWKDIFTSALKRLKVVPGLDGGFVVLGGHTSRMTKAEMSELLELIEAFGAERGVMFSWPQDAVPE